MLTINIKNSNDVFSILKSNDSIKKLKNNKNYGKINLESVGILSWEEFYEN